MALTPAPIKAEITSFPWYDWFNKLYQYLDRAASNGCFQDTTTQTAASANTAYALSCNTTDFARNVAVINGTRFTVNTAGRYNIAFSAQFENSDTQAHDVDIWFAVSGTNVAGSNSQITIPSKHGTVNGHFIAAWNIFLDMVQNDYVEIMWSTTSTTVSIPTIPPQTSPTRPETPSVIVTINQVLT